MNDNDPNLSSDPSMDPNVDLNPWWDFAEPECRWIPQCHRMLQPDGCDGCECLRDDVVRDEDGDPIFIPD